MTNVLMPIVLGTIALALVVDVAVLVGLLWRR
jgi:hypothetical protein